MKFKFTDMTSKEEKSLDVILQFYFGKLYKECNKNTNKTVKRIVYECFGYPIDDRYNLPYIDEESISFSMKREERMDNLEIFGLVKCHFEYYKLEQSKKDHLKIEVYVNDILRFYIRVKNPSKKMKTHIHNKVQGIIYSYKSEIKQFEKLLKESKLPL